MLRKKPQQTSPKPQNPLVGITIFLFVYLLIKPVPQLVSGRGKWKKREKKTRTQWKIIEKCSNREGKKATKGRQSHPQNENEIVPDTKVNCNRKKRS